MFTYRPLGSDAADSFVIQGFKPVHKQGANLVHYLQNEAFKDEQAGLMRTYLVYEDSISVPAAYFSLKAGLASTNERRVLVTRNFDTVPGIELANFAVNGAFRDKYALSRGCGRIIFMGPVMDVVKHTAEFVGVQMVYLYALPYSKVIKNYESYGFKRLDKRQERRLHDRLRPRYDQGCVFMSMLLS